MTLDTITVVIIGNALGLMLLITLLFSNIGKGTEKNDIENVFRIIIVAMIACIADPVVYSVDGKEGLIYTIIIYAGNSWLYIANMLTGVFWVQFVAMHLNIKVNFRHKISLVIMLAFGCLCLVVNIFYPIVFKVENNVYERAALYWIFVMAAGVCMLDSIAMYIKAKKAGGLLRLFPIGVFIIPVVAGVVIQSLFYGVSVIWASVAVAIAGVMVALKNEIIFQDRLTGLYNRSYLDYVQNDIVLRKSEYLTGIMIDMNDFKAINDRFGHAAGDEALKIVADILKKATSERGSAIRYAGDEFVILLNTVDDSVINRVLAEIRNDFENFNNSGKKPYILSASMGHASFDVNNQSMNDFMNTIDRKMYEDKELYYKTHQKQGKSS